MTTDRPHPLKVKIQTQTWYGANGIHDSVDETRVGRSQVCGIQTGSRYLETLAEKGEKQKEQTEAKALETHSQNKETGTSTNMRHALHHLPHIGYIAL